MSWKSIADLIVTAGDAPVALLGAPMEAGSVTPGRCDLAPATVRKALRRFSTYDVTRDAEIAVTIYDRGDAPVTGLMPADGFAAIRDAVTAATAAHDLTILIGGNNAVTRPAVHGLGRPLDQIGLITLDAHFDMRETDIGPRNGNPIRCLLEDGLPGANVRQIGLAPFANTGKMAADVRAAGGRYWTIADCEGQGIEAVIEAALADLAHLPAIIVDFDIDVIDRPQLPGAPGARPGGMKAADFFRAARRLASEPKVRLVDLTEFDPSLDLSDISALVAGRWLCEILSGYEARA